LEKRNPGKDLFNYKLRIGYSPGNDIWVNLFRSSGLTADTLVCKADLPVVPNA